MQCATNGLYFHVAIYACSYVCMYSIYISELNSNVSKNFKLYIANNYFFSINVQTNWMTYTAILKTKMYLKLK